MSNIHTLADVKAKYGEKVIETGTSFVVNAYGKYQPNISFVLAKDFGDDPLKYRSGAPTREMIAGMGFDFGTSESGVSVLFGDFWSSKAGKPHFRPKSPQTATHVIVQANWGGFSHPRTRGRWDAPEGAAYFRRASSNGGGTGCDYYVLPVGYYLVVHDEELDGDVVVTPDFSARAKTVRASFEAYDHAAEAEVEAEAARREAKAKAEAARREVEEKAKAASREAKASGLGTRLEAAQNRLKALQSSNPDKTYPELVINEYNFDYGWATMFYNEENVALVECWLDHYEEQDNKSRLRAQAQAKFRPMLEALIPRADILDLTLIFGEDTVNYHEDNGEYRSFPYNQWGVDFFKAALTRKEMEVARKTAKASAEAEAEVLGLPQNIRIWKRTGGATGCGMGWVITPDGFDRERDGLENDNPRRAARYDEGYLVWKQILPGELVLAWRKAFTAAEHEFEVVHLPSEGVTEAQLERVAEIQQELQDTWAGRRGLASGIPSPAVGRGWGFGDFVTLPSKPETVYSTESDEETTEPVDMEDALQRLQNKFGSKHR